MIIRDGDEIRVQQENKRAVGTSILIGGLCLFFAIMFSLPVNPETRTFGYVASALFLLLGAALVVQQFRNRDYVILRPDALGFSRGVRGTEWVPRRSFTKARVSLNMFGPDVILLDDDLRVVQRLVLPHLTVKELRAAFEEAGYPLTSEGFRFGRPRSD
jgi:hypothetical protein